VRKATTQNITI
jgi:hydrocephalus-inducing protein